MAAAASTAPPRPVALEPIFESMPDKITGIPKWVVWRYGFKNDGWTKIPLASKDLSAGSSTNPATWSAFASDS